MSDTLASSKLLPPGLTVVVTRPDDQAQTLCGLVAEAGGRALKLPLLAIEPLPHTSAGAIRLGRLENFDWLVFISANAVRYGVPHLPARFWQNPGKPRVAAIGAATRNSLERHGVTVDLHPKAQFNSEALLAQPEWADLKDKRVLIVRGEGGREVLADALRARGAAVEYAEVYRRTRPPLDVSELLTHAHAGTPLVLTVTSGDALLHLAAALDRPSLASLKRLPIVVISERLANLARELGFHDPRIAVSASDRAILDAIVELATTRADSSHPYQHQGDTALADEDKPLTLNEETPILASEAEPSGSVPPPPRRRHRVATWLGYGALLLTVLLVAAGVYLLQELRSKQEGLGGELNKDDMQMLELSHQISGLQAELAALHNQFANLQAQVTTEDNKFERQISEQGASFTERLASVKGSLEDSVQHIQRQLNKSRGDLMVADAEYLLSIANQKLHLVGDVKSVLAAMEAADQRLHDSGDPAAFKVREVLAEEINQLKKFNAPDVIGISAKLLALEARVKELPLFLPHADKGKTRQEEHAQEHGRQTSADKTNLIDSTFHGLRDLVTVRRSDRPADVILEPAQAEALRQVLLLKLEMVRAALLRGDDALYQANLESAIAWLEEHFDRQASSMQSMKEELSALKNVQLRLPFPDVSKSLALLRNIEKLRLEAETREAKHPPMAEEPTAAPDGEASKPEAGVQP